MRDAEIEALVRDYARPILQAAGLSKSGINIVLVNDRRFNAFVDGRRIFINTGALVTAETPNEIIGVLAHETGHLAGGHQQRLRDQLARAQTMAIVASLLGVGADGGRCRHRQQRRSRKSGMGIAAGGAEVARRGLLGYQRTEEVTADRSAVTYLEKTGQSAKGMLKTFQRFQSALSLSGTQVDPYQISHPMPQERIANLRGAGDRQPLFRCRRSAGAAVAPRYDARQDRRLSPRAAQRCRGCSARDRSRSAAYGDAIYTYLHGNLKSALAKTDALIKAQPKNPYLYELRGDILLKSNKAKDAAAAYAKAVSLDPVKSGLLQVVVWAGAGRGRRRRSRWRRR